MTLDEKRIKEQAKEIMDEFVKALEKAGTATGEPGLDREEMTRAGKAEKTDTDFRERMLKNAPRKEGSHIVTEKKKW